MSRFVAILLLLKVTYYICAFDIGAVEIMIVW